MAVKRFPVLNANLKSNICLIERWLQKQTSKNETLFRQSRRRSQFMIQEPLRFASSYSIYSWYCTVNAMWLLKPVGLQQKLYPVVLYETSNCCNCCQEATVRIQTRLGSWSPPPKCQHFALETIFSCRMSTA